MLNIFTYKLGYFTFENFIYNISSYILCIIINVIYCGHINLNLNNVFKIQLKLNFDMQKII